MPLDLNDTLSGQDLYAWLQYEADLKCARRSPKTIENYAGAVAQLAGRIAPVPVIGASRAAITDYLIWLAETRSDGSARNRYAALHAYYAWLAAEDIIAKSPMLRVPKPGLGQKVPQVLSDADLTALFAACAPPPGAAPFQRLMAARDRAMIGLWCEPGSPRLAEMAGIGMDDADLRGAQVLVHGKGGKDRLVPLSAETVRDLLRYLRLRAAHPAAGRKIEIIKDGKPQLWEPLWLGKRGALSASGAGQMLDDRSQAAGIGHVHPHMMRHTTWHRWRLRGGDIDDGMRLWGWSRVDMAILYGRSAAEHRALTAGRTMNLRSGL